MEDTIYLRCKRCNRPLKDNVSKNRGYGNKCWRIHNMEIKHLNQKASIFEILSKVDEEEENTIEIQNRA